MTFQDTDILIIGIALGGLLVALGFRRLAGRARRLITFAALWRRLSDAREGPRRAVGVVLAAGAVLCMAAGLAGPEGGLEEGTLEQRGMDIVFSVDVSRSMLAREGPATRLGKAGQEIQALLNALAGDRVGLVAFAGSAGIVCPLTTDLNSLSLFLDSLDGEMIPSGGTALAEGISLAQDLLETSGERSRAIVLVTDGEDLADPKAALAAAGAAREARIPIFAVMYGEPGGAKIPDPVGEGFILGPDGSEVISRPNSGLLRSIAARGEGAFVADWETAFPLDHLYNRHLDRLPEQVQGERHRPKRKNLFQVFVAASLALLLFDLFIPLRRFKARSLIWFVLLGLSPSQDLVAADAPVARAMDRGIRSYQEQDYAEAQAEFEKALLREKENPDLWANLGLAYLKQDMYEAALHAFERARAFLGTQGARAALFGTALVHFKQGRQALTDASDSDPARQRAALAQALDSLAQARTLFAACRAQDAWPEEARINLVLAGRLMKEAEQQLEEARGQGGEQGVQEEGGAAGVSTGRTGEAGEAGGRSAAGVEGSEAREGAIGRDPRLSIIDRPMNRVEKLRIFELLQEMERERIFLEKKIVKAVREAKGGRDW
jgi:Ca-activated chloride channel family protein